MDWKERHRMAFLDDMKVFIFFGILVVVAIGGLGRRFLGWGIKPGEDKPAAAPSPTQQKYAAQQAAASQGAQNYYPQYGYQQRR